jgi:hypothetical protein
MPGKAEGCMIVSTPFGEECITNVKQEDNQIMMGPWTMTEVVVRIAKYMSPTIIGFRMPIGFDLILIPFYVIEDAGTPYNAVDVRKVGPQLFIILSVSENF